MASSFFFYDLETSGFDAREARIMQFAGIRTDTELQPIGEPFDIKIKLTPDTLPSPDAILVTGITPQSTIAEGVTEAEFLKIFFDEVVQPDTVFLGFNTVRFDDEFMRNLMYRNFYDPYEWQWCDGCTRWDLLDVVRMTRALRPDGIEWPFNEEGKPTNRLELITELNGIEHYAAHDALSDVYATIAVAKLIRDKQPKLFEHLLGCRGKKEIKSAIANGQPFVYSSGKYPSEYEKTATVVPIAEQPQARGVYVYDLRHDPGEFVGLSPEQLVDRWRYNRDEAAPARLPVKMLLFNHCPAVAPMGVLDQSSRQRLQIDLSLVSRNLAKIKAAKDFAANVLKAVEIMDKERDSAIKAKGPADVDGRLYDGFLAEVDKALLRTVRTAKPDELNSFADKLRDERMRLILPRFKARNYPSSLNEDERRDWENFCRERLFDGGRDSRLAQYFARLSELANTNPQGDAQYILEELQLYGQSLIPADAGADDEPVN